MRFIKDYIRSKLAAIAAEASRPHMVKGYKDPSGVFRKKTRIASTVVLQRPEGISIGENVFVNHFAYLDGSGGLVIEEGCQVGAWVGIFTHSSHMSLRLLGKHYAEIPEDQKAGYVRKPVRIGRYTGIAFGAKITPGVTIGKGCMIHPNTLVHRDVPDFTVVQQDGSFSGDSRVFDRRYTRKDEALRRWVEEWQDDAKFVPE